MKTKNKSVVTTMALTIDEIIFSNRNQAYGAFNLRKNYSKHLFSSLTITSFIFTSIAMLAFHLSRLKDPVPLPPQKGTIMIIDTLDVSKPDPITIPTDPPVQIQKSIAYSPNFKIVDTVSSYKLIAALDPEIMSNPVVENPNVVYIEPKSKGKEIDEDTGLYFVEEPASFQGGDLRTFHEWVQEHVGYPREALEAGISGMMNIKFAVNSKGEISDIKIVRGLHPVIDETTVKVLMSSPKWTPAKQNGKVVKQLFSMPLNFKIYE